MGWTPFRRVTSTSSLRHDQDDARRDAEQPPMASPGLPRAVVPEFIHHPLPENKPDVAGRTRTLDAIGQRDEVVRQRIDSMTNRLEDLRTLQDDFALILDPLSNISAELLKASVQVEDLKQKLSQEVKNSGTLRELVANLTTDISRVSRELAESQVHAEQISDRLKEGEAAVVAQKIELRDKSSLVESLERQLFTETEQNKAFASENRALRQEAQAADTALARSEHELADAREKLGLLEAEGRRLQLLSEEQAARLADLDFKYRELETTTDADHQRLRAIEGQLAAELSLRERNDAQHETEMSALRTERASLAMKLETSSNRAASTEQLLVQARNQLREKDEEFRSADRSLKEAVIARTTSERRLEAIQADLSRQNERFIDIQRVKGDLESRCDMLNKALAAKDAALEQANNRNASLNDRIEHLTHRHESVRADLETSNRRLLEDLQNERSERSLLQGALDIARESRVSLQKQHDAFKRSGRPWRDIGKDDANAESPDYSGEEASNVRPFNTPSK
ncbi:chromosome partitioning protein ParA [Methylobacterium sp. Leaf108]|nr:chromosome partitioning protein ParA [Methylobacterium sp. Leaf108]